MTSMMHKRSVTIIFLLLFSCLLLPSIRLKQPPCKQNHFLEVFKQLPHTNMFIFCKQTVPSRKSNLNVFKWELQLFSQCFLSYLFVFFKTIGSVLKIYTFFIFSSLFTSLIYVSIFFILLCKERALPCLKHHKFPLVKNAFTWDLISVRLCDTRLSHMLFDCTGAEKKHKITR